jgi:SOS-response transcriptional repressor LexA
MTINQTRLKNLLTLISENKSMANVARLSDTSEKYLWQIVHERKLPSGKTQGVGNNLARKLEAGCNKPAGWLDAPHHALTKQASREHKDYLAIPVFEASASMGLGKIQPEQDLIVGGITLSNDWVRQNLGSISSSKNLAVIPAYGDSMTPTFRDGDLLLIDRGVDSIRLDAVYVLALSQELFVKRLQRRPDQSLLMISDNKAYEPYNITAKDRSLLSVLGRVVWAWNGLKL